MAVFKPKTRVISFRLSEEEYQSLRQRSLAQGAHSVSDYARLILCRFLAGQPSHVPDEFEAKVVELDEKMRQVEHQLKQLARAIRQSREAQPPGLLTAAARVR